MTSLQQESRLHSAVSDIPFLLSLSSGSGAHAKVEDEKSLHST